MPLFYHLVIDKDTSLAIWKITEVEDFFTDKIRLRKEINHPHKRLQHLAGRYLLQFLEPNFPLDDILILDSNKPIASSHPIHFSISHCCDFAAAIVTRDHSAGIDLEMMASKIERIQDKFLNNREREILSLALDADQRRKILTIIWSAKESMVKWYGQGKVDFKKHLHIKDIDFSKCTVQARFEGSVQKNVTIHFQFFDTLCLTYFTESLSL